MFETKTTTQKHLFAYMVGRELTVRRDYRPALRNKGRRYDLNRLTDASQRRLARVLNTLPSSVEMDYDLGLTVYFHTSAVQR
jgi:hypothetical protein